MRPDDPAYPGQRHYGWWLLNIYDPFVLGFMAKAVWRFSTPLLVEHYRRHLGRRHLDVGPGTGYFLDQVAVPGQAITLLDPNPKVLAHAARRLKHLDVTTVEADVLKPLPVEGSFDSAALSLVLHCLPGPPPRKAAAVANVARILTKEGVLFGATVLGTPDLHTRRSRAVLWAFNRQGVFDNLLDTDESLREILEASFEAVEIRVVGTVAMFAATIPSGRAANPNQVTIP